MAWRLFALRYDSVMKKDWGSKMESLQALFDEAHPFGRAKIVLEPSKTVFTADLAESPEQRARGMIGREFTDTRAMLFVEPVETTGKFHMRGVTQPLVLAIFDRDGNYLEAIRMGAESERVVSAYGFKYALEMSPEFFESIDWAGQKIVVQSEPKNRAHPEVW